MSTPQRAARRYTLDEIDDLRAAVWGEWGWGQSGTAEQVEERLRTHMFNGSTAAEVREHTEKRNKEKEEAERRQRIERIRGYMVRVLAGEKITFEEPGRYFRDYWHEDRQWVAALEQQLGALRRPESIPANAWDEVKDAIDHPELAA